MISRPADPRQTLAESISKVREWEQYCLHLDAELSSRESALLKANAAQRAEAEAALETARMANVSAEQQALRKALGHGPSLGLTVAQAEAELAAMRDRHDGEWHELTRAKAEAQRQRGTSLAAALRASDAAISGLFTAEGLVRTLLDRYQRARRELGLCYRALVELPPLCRPSGYWESPVLLTELQQADGSVADQVASAVSALQLDPDHPLPTARSPLPEAAD
jgi:hypothetical protein